MGERQPGIVREDPPPGVAPGGPWPGRGPIIPPPALRPGRPRPLRRLISAAFTVAALGLQAVVILTLVDQLAPDLNIRYVALKYLRWVPYGARYVSWWLRVGRRS